jgi:hypothetical protein
MVVRLVDDRAAGTPAIASTGRAGLCASRGSAETVNAASTTAATPTHRGDDGEDMAQREYALDVRFVSDARPDSGLGGIGGIGGISAADEAALVPRWCAPWDSNPEPMD